MAAGASQMAQNFGSGSTQGVMMVTVSSQAAGSSITLSDESGTKLVSWTAEKAFDSVVISCPEIEEGSAYTLTAGESVTVAEGNAFPQEEFLDEKSGELFFREQTCCRVAVDGERRILGLYILHPNNVGRCGHISNASYAVDSRKRGLHIGEKLVRDCVLQAKIYGFRILQFNAVVASNLHARHLYERIGFRQLGTIPGGFRMKDGSYEDICPYYIEV